jgi:hypothetical protein
VSDVTYNFDDEDKYVEFEIFGKKYQFWYPTTEQEDEAREKKTDNLEFLKSMVKRPEGAEYEEFSEVYPKMNVKQINAFTKMIKIELGD